MEATIKRLIADGWKEYPDQFRQYARCFCKQFETKTPCRCNSDRAGIQVCCSVSKLYDVVRYEFDLCGELHDGTWVKLLQYALPGDIDDGLKLIPRMLDAWEFMVNKQTEGTK